MSSTTTIFEIIKDTLIKNILLFISFLLAFFFVIFLQKARAIQPEIVFLNVGQGDATLIQQDNFQILVDGGFDDSVIYELARYVPWYDKTIEVLVLTHPHSDHLDGLLLVLKKYEVKKIVYSPIEYQSRSYEYLLGDYSRLLKPVSVGDIIRYKDIFLTAIYPFEERGQEENINNESIVLFLEVMGYKILLMGDIEKEIEQKFTSYSFLKNIDIVKAGHHCSNTSSSDMFLSFLKPSIAICSCGRGNKFGHPGYETVENFKKHNVQYLITYEEGSIKFQF